MFITKIKSILFYVVFLIFLNSSIAFGTEACDYRCKQGISFVEFPSVNIADGTPLIVKGKLKLPPCVNFIGYCDNQTKRNLPAVVILHGSSGIDFRGDFYARALNFAGIATLEIDMWEARGIKSPEERPPVPIFNYPDAFAALNFLSEHPNIDGDRIGVQGFSWGGVISMASATELYSGMFGNGLRFAAHVAHYPVCYAYNNPNIPGVEFTDLTGAPLLIQVGELDDYDDGSAPCFALKQSLVPEDQIAVEVVAYKGAFHAWDRLQVPITVTDPFSHRGTGANDNEVQIIPNVLLAHQSRARVVEFFRRNLR